MFNVYFYIKQNFKIKTHAKNTLKVLPYTTEGIKNVPTNN